MIRRAQSVGFNLAELKELATLKAKNDRFPIEVANKLIASKREKLRQDMNALRALGRRLMALETELKQTFG